MGQEMIQASVAPQTGDIETPLPQEDAINPWGYQAAQLKKDFQAAKHLVSLSDL